MARSVREAPNDPTGRHDALAAVGASMAVIVLAAVMFGLAGRGARPDTRDGEPAPVGPDQDRVMVFVPVEPPDDALWKAFLADVPGTIPEAMARAAGEQACLMLGGNAGGAAALRAVRRVGIPADAAGQVLAASRRHICP
jgi:succinate dehydrogenase/fumarate reductase flavoprotein subunit